MKPLFFLEGIQSLSKALKGTENIYLGIRPYGFHAGNMIPFVVYPLLLCKQLALLGKNPAFTLYVFINDWEQDGLDGPDVIAYPFNIYPKSTTFQYMPYAPGAKNTMAQHWAPIILNGVSIIKKHFPQVNIIKITNSSMKTNPIMKKHLLYTIRRPHAIATILKNNSHTKILQKPKSYAMAVCPHCHKAKGETRVLDTNTIHHHCFNCGNIIEGNYQYFDYWFYHKPLAIPRLEIYDIDLCITGFDHYKEGDFVIRQKLIKALESKARLPLTLYTPTLLGRNGEVMGKSRGNAEALPLATLIQLVEKNPQSDHLLLNSL